MFALDFSQLPESILINAQWRGGVRNSLRCTTPDFSRYAIGRVHTMLSELATHSFDVLRSRL